MSQPTSVVTAGFLVRPQGRVRPWTGSLPLLTHRTSGREARGSPPEPERSPIETELMLGVWSEAALRARPRTVRSPGSEPSTRSRTPRCSWHRQSPASSPGSRSQSMAARPPQVPIWSRSIDGEKLLPRKPDPNERSGALHRSTDGHIDTVPRATALRNTGRALSPSPHATQVARFAMPDLGAHREPPRRQRESTKYWPADRSGYMPREVLFATVTDWLRAHEPGPKEWAKLSSVPCAPDTTPATRLEASPDQERAFRPPVPGF
jgi:hypothetical protein